MGGALGAMCALGGAVEHQKMSTPHFHAQGHVVCAYQYHTLQDIADKLQAQFFTVDDLKQYQSWMHRGEVVDEDAYKEFRPRVEKEWAEAHHSLCVTPEYAVRDAALEPKNMYPMPKTQTHFKLLWRKECLGSRNI